MINELSFDKDMKAELSHLRNYALSLTMNMDDAKDLMQETVLKAYRYQSKFTYGTNLRGWLFTILKNTFINNYRKNMKRNTFLDSTENNFYLDTPTNNLENDGEKSFMRKDFDSAIDSLPVDIRVAFLLNAEGFKYREISEELNIPIGTVKTRIFLAKKILRIKLSAYANIYGLHYTRGSELES